MVIIKHEDQFSERLDGWIKEGGATSDGSRPPARGPLFGPSERSLYYVLFVFAPNIVIIDLNTEHSLKKLANSKDNH
jgi:hypothetical protein